MNKEQGNYFRMFLNIQNFMDNQTTVWSVIPRVTTYKNNLDEVISRITEKSAAAMNGVGISERKLSLKQAIGIKAAALSGAMQVLSLELNNPDLAKSVHLNKSDVDNAREQDIDGMVRNVVSKAQENLDDLADLGVTEAVLTETLTTVEEFNGLIGKPRSILNNKYVTLDSIEQLFDEGNDLLRNRMDRLMLMFKDSSPEFYNGYERARTIVDL